MSNAVINNVRQVLKSLKLGVIFYRVYYAPKDFLIKTFRKGAINAAVDYQSQVQMEKMAYRLEPLINDSSDSPLEIHFLTGEKFWYQTCFCAYSMAQHTTSPIHPIIYDDGSLTKKYQYAIQNIFPKANIILKQEIEERINKYLPESKFPYLRERRLNYPNMRKLTDIHVGSTGWKLVLDSDMLFFQIPNFLLHWLKSPQQPCYMVDVQTSYGYSDALMANLAQAKIPELVNVGICGLKSEDIDWGKLEYWCKTLIEKQGTNYYQEQALVAMLIADRESAIAPAQDYIVLPSREEAINPKAVLHHYVAESKSWYFRYGWKHIVASMSSIQ